MCNIVTEFYLYSIVYIYLINSRLDVTYSVRHHFHIELYQYLQKNSQVFIKTTTGVVYMDSAYVESVSTYSSHYCDKFLDYPVTDDIM